MNDRQRLLFEFVKAQHGDQKRKYTEAPYWTHVLSVAEIVYLQRDDQFHFEIALCHDVLEDTSNTESSLISGLLSCGYSIKEAFHISEAVKELTDMYTKESYPNLNRAKRKKLEAVRLSKISSHAQTVKYADLIDNIGSIVKYDPSFAKIYLKEKGEILKLMRNGNESLRSWCEDVYNEACKKLEMI